MKSWLFIQVLPVSFILSLFLTILARKVGRRYGFFDLPGALKIHEEPIPYLGGAAIFLGFFLGIACMIRINAWMNSSMLLPWLWGIFTGGFLILVLGLLDDLRGLRPVYRLLGQILAGTVLVMSGLTLQIIPLIPVSIVLTIFYVVGTCNAMNLLDGMDGLAGGVAAIAALGFLGLSLAQDNILGAYLSLTLLGSCLGFLPYNYSRASIFMGDNGSNIIGFILATIMVVLADKPYSFIWFLAPILVMGLPILDTGWAIIRRARKREPLIMGDRGHIYDQLMKRGFSIKETLFINYALGMGCSGVAILLVAMFNKF